ncbi:MAG: alpha-2-macroglobulin family protein [Acetobacteraceae bacterium]|nr:alpha-2-macroglobulin family protein [Acetobacteraceae bacterium]
MAARILFVLGLFLLAAMPCRAAAPDLPGLQRDAQAYILSLTKRVPAGGTPAARRTAEQQAAAAMAKQDWPAAVTALETRVAQGEVTPKQLLDLATAQMQRTPPDPKAALHAAWMSLAGGKASEAEIPGLLLMAEALRALDRGPQSLIVLQAVVDRAPANPAYQKTLADARRAVGVVVKKLNTEADADPPRVCVEFTVPPVRRPDFVPGDWVRLMPPVPGAAVTREEDLICVSGLPPGTTTRLTLRAGMPGEAGLTLVKETALAVAIPNLASRIVFDSRLFVLPRGQTPSVTMTTINLSAVSLRLIRLTERNVSQYLREAKLGEALDVWKANNLASHSGREVWTGTAPVTKWEPNKPARVALPFPEALATAGPGLYALIATPGDGTAKDDDASAVQMILRTDLAPTVWRGSDGLTVQVRGYSDAKPRSDVRLALLARNNDILAEARTDAQGFAKFPAPLLLGEGPLAPAALHAFGVGDDFAALDLNVASFDLSDRGVEGMPHPGPLDAFVWLDRGIYRPGETVQVMAILRDAAGLPADLPATVTIKRPNGQVFLRATPARTGDASLHLPVILSSGAAAGTWKVEINADPKASPIGSMDFRVDAFVPDRMAVEAGPAPALLIPGQAATIPVSARFLYGAPAAGLTGKAKLRLIIDPDPFPALSGYRIGVIGETYAPDSRHLEMADTDAEGRTTLPVTIEDAPDVTRPVKAEIDIEVDDPSGRASRANVSIPVRPAGASIGIKPLFPDDAVDAQAEAAFDVAAVKPDGTRTRLAAKLRLVRERPDWRMVMRGSVARYETVWKDEPLETRDVAIPEGQPFRFSKRLDFGRYRIEVAQTGGMAVTSYRFRAGWASSDSPDVPDRVDVSADRKTVPVGQTVRIHIAPPFAGEATLLVLSDKVLLTRILAVPEAGTTVDVPVEASWGPGAYVAVHVFRGGATNRPGRALGLTWVAVDPTARTMAVTIDTPEKILPRGRLYVPVKADPGAWLTMAVVDEGILRLTRFVSPNPVAHFLSRRRLGLDIRDDWGRLLAPAEGEATLLKQGGDDSGTPLPDIPIRTVTLFTPPLQAGADGLATIPIDIPDFNGQVRLMVVAWHGSRIGGASKNLIVRDPLIAEALLPRFLAPGDDARLAVLLHNIDLPAGEAKVVISTGGPLTLNGTDTLSAVLEPGQRAVPGTILRATGAGRGVVKLSITGPGGYNLLRDTAITVRPSRGLGSIVAGAELAPGAEVRLAPATDRFIPGTWRASAMFGGPVRYDAAGVARELAGYPWSCLEQTTSRGFPLVMLPDGPMAGDDRAGRLQTAVSSVLDRQRFDGAFALWAASGEAEAWLTSYAMDFLLRAKAAGAVVPDQAVTDALKFLREASDEDSSTPEAMAAQAYRLYILARAGQGRPGAARVLAEELDKLPTPLAKAQLGAALMLAHDRPRAEAAFTAALGSPARKWWYKDYGTSLRDQLATVVLLKESGVLPQRLTALTAALPGADLRAGSLSTQEQAWAVAAAASLGKDGQLARIRLDGKDLPAAASFTAALNGPVIARNLGDRAVWQAVSVTGVPIEPPAAARAGMRIIRKFLRDDGSPVDLDTLRQNTSFVLLLEGRAEDGQEHRALVVQGLPAGWEIVGRFNEGGVPGMSWLDKLSGTEAQPAADDRYAAIVPLEPNAPGFRVAVRLRAVTPGSFELPGAELSDMYRPGIFARQAVARIKVLAAE